MRNSQGESINLLSEPMVHTKSHDPAQSIDSDVAAIMAINDQGAASDQICDQQPATSDELGTDDQSDAEEQGQPGAEGGQGPSTPSPNEETIIEGWLALNENPDARMVGVLTVPNKSGEWDLPRLHAVYA